MQSGSTTTSARSSWSAARVIPDEVAKELLSQNELEMDQLDVQKGSVGTSVLTTGDVIENGEQDYDASDTQRQTWSR